MFPAMRRQKREKGGSCTRSDGRKESYNLFPISCSRTVIRYILTTSAAGALHYLHSLSLQMKHPNMKRCDHNRVLFGLIIQCYANMCATLVCVIVIQAIKTWWS